MAEKVKREFGKTLSHGAQRVTTVFSRKGKVKRVEIQDNETSQPDPASDLAKMIDHTLLKPEATEEMIRKLCAEAVENGFGAVCVNLFWVPLCVEILKDTDVKVAATIGFPLGATNAATKAFETKQAIKAGAQEIDMVMNVGALKSGYFADVANDIREVVLAAHKRNVIVKVILETGFLTEDEKVTACLLAKEAGADFVKTATGFAGFGATVEDVALMRSVVGQETGVKAAGGVRTYADARQMVSAGATRIGTSGGVRIVQEARGETHTAEPSAGY